MSGGVLVAPAGLTAMLDDLAKYANGPVKVGRFHTYLADLAGWHLNLTDQNPCIWVQAADLANGSSQQLAAELQVVVQKRTWQNSTILLFVDGPTDALHPHLTTLPLTRFVAFDAADQHRLETAVSPHDTALDLLRRKMACLDLSPYETSKPVTGNRFFGREQEIERVLQHAHTSYLFVGIRRIGKTSLLKEIKRRLDRMDLPERGQIRRVYIDCTVISSEEEFMRTLIFQLEQSGLTILSSRAQDPQRYQKRILDHYAMVHGSPITFLLDEFDRLLAHMRPDWPLLTVLKTAVQAKKVRFISAGFRRAMEAATNKHSPLYNLMTPVRLGRLPLSDVEKMVLTPMSQLDIKISEPTRLIERIYRETAGLPNYVQYYCKILLEQFACSSNNILSPDSLSEIQEDTEFRDFVLNTFMANTELLEQVIVYAIIGEGEAVAQHHFTERKIHGFLKKRNLSLPYERIDGACRNLEMAGVFKRTNADYMFAVPLFQHILRQMRDVRFLFDRTHEALQTENILS